MSSDLLHDEMIGRYVVDCDFQHVNSVSPGESFDIVFADFVVFQFVVERDFQVETCK